jgi:GTPase SAR1 family protein
LHLPPQGVGPRRQGFSPTYLGVGKTSLILSFLHGTPPEPALLPHVDDLYFFSKRQDYPLQRPSERDLFDPATRYECRFHIWDLGPSCYSRDAFANFIEQKFYENTVALIYVFRDEVPAHPRRHRWSS